MRNPKEILKRLYNYERNLNNLNLAQKQIIKQAMLELSWVLGEESNILYDGW